MVRHRIAGLAGALWLVAAHVFAAPAIISGTGTGGALGAANGLNGASLSLVVPTTAAVPAVGGNFVIVGANYRAANAISSVTDSAATPNTYSSGAATTSVASASSRTFYGAVASALPAPCTVTASMAVANTLVITGVGTCASNATFTTNQSVTGTSVTVPTVFVSPCTLVSGAATCSLSGDAGTPGSETMTISSSVIITYAQTTGGKDATLAAFSGLNASPFDAASTTANTTGTGAITIGPTGTLGSSSALIIGNLAFANTGAVTEDAAFTSLGTNLTNSFGHMAYKIVSANTAISYVPTLSGTSGAYTAQLQAFDSTAGAATAKQSCALMGVC